MTRRLTILGFIVVFIVGFLFLRGPTPHIVIRAEKLTDLGPIPLTNTMITGWLVVAVIVIFMLIATRSWSLIPNRLQNFVEAAFEAFYNLVTGIAGEANGRRFFPVVATIFFFIVIGNWMSLLPGFNVIGWVGHETPEAEQIAEDGFVHGIIFDDISIGPVDLHYIGFSDPGNLRVTSDENVIESDDPDGAERFHEAEEDGKFVGELIPVFRGVNTDLNTPLAIAIAAFIAVEFWGISSLGFFTYGSKFINFSSPINFFVGILELVSELVRLVSFTFRLFGNMFAGEVVILMFTFLTPLILTLPFYGLEIFVGVIQAFIFAMLTLVFGVVAVAHHGDHDEERAHHGESGEGTVEGSLHETVAEPST
ncbi:MAG TPA: F0F1 ATP synthase subunit A [Dehalococcoidia bacterium]|nr:F0F1 ATP synthase subunit A [Dehalococcoidia bacterium]